MDLFIYNSPTSERVAAMAEMEFSEILKNIESDKYNSLSYALMILLYAESKNINNDSIKQLDEYYRNQMKDFVSGDPFTDHYSNHNLFYSIVNIYAVYPTLTKLYDVRKMICFDATDEELDLDSLKCVDFYEIHYNQTSERSNILDVIIDKSFTHYDIELIEKYITYNLFNIKYLEFKAESYDIDDIYESMSMYDFGDIVNSLESMDILETLQGVISNFKNFRDEKDEFLNSVTELLNEHNL